MVKTSAKLARRSRRKTPEERKAAVRTRTLRRLLRFMKRKVDELAADMKANDAMGAELARLHDEAIRERQRILAEVARLENTPVTLQDGLGRAQTGGA